MNLDTVISTALTTSLADVVNLCPTSIAWTAGNWLYKSLPEYDPSIKRVRVRHRIANSAEALSFNQALSHCTHNLWGRHITATFTKPEPTTGTSAYAVFFPETFQMVRADVDSIMDALEISSKQSSDIASLIREAISEHCTPITATDITLRAVDSVIIYSVPYYYAVRTDLLPQLLQHVK